jgi:EAL domain-containing protein (putative c-di-GMP-specific phosphodiesterase class I)
MSVMNVAPSRAAILNREQRRLLSLAEYGLADPDIAKAIGTGLAEHTRFARELTGTEGAAVNIVSDGFQQTIALAADLPLIAMKRFDSICGRILYATGAGDLFITSDASVDPDLWDSPWVSGASGAIRFYAGAALIGREGLPLGMLCVWSTEPFTEQAAERAGQRLISIRDSVVDVLEARRGSGLAQSGHSFENDELTAELADLVAAPRATPIDAIINDCTIQTIFQPIVDLATGSVVAFEALTRGPSGTPLEAPMALLEAARAAGRLGEFDWLCRTNAMRLAAESGLPANLSWFINVEPAGLEIDCPQHLRPTLDQARAGLRVVLEVVERDVEAHVTRLLHAAEQARRDAWGVALDDVGAETGSLALLPFLQPDVVKLDMSLLRHAPSSTAAEITAAVRSYAERTGAVILAEGIETQEQEELAKVFGATYGQGYRYGRPTALPQELPTPIRPIPLRQRPAPIEGATPFEALNATISSQHGRPEHLMHIFAHLMSYCQHADEGAVMLLLFDNQARFLDNKILFDTLAEHNALSVCLVPGLSPRPSHARYHVGPLPAGCRLTQETAMIIITPQYSGALVTRKSDQLAADGTPLLEYIYTHDRSAIVESGRAYLDQMRPGTITYPRTSDAVTDNQCTEQTRRGRLTNYLNELLRQD